MTAKIKKGGTRGNVFKDVSRMRLGDADALLKSGRYSGSLYLSGYAVECALKWAITEQLDVDNLPEEYEIHNLQVLLHAAELLPAMQREPTIQSRYSAIVDEWEPSRRYSAAKVSKQDATTLYNQARQVYEWIIERKS